MSPRYEMNTSDCNLELVPPGTELGEDALDDGIYGLVIGNPRSTAYVVKGNLDQLRDFVRRIENLVTDEMNDAASTDQDEPQAGTADTGDAMANEIPLPEPGQPLRVVWYVPDEQQAVLWTRDGVTFEAPLLVPPADPENPYRVDWPLTAWSQARPSNRAVDPIVPVADVDLDDRRGSLPRYGMPLMVCSDDELVWKASDDKLYTTPGGASPLYWNSPEVEHGWVVDFTTYEEVHPYDSDSGPDHEHLLERPF